ncbi:MAG: hypothetical protein SRB2_01062 [Desulfobacteraceae bacterium Eth-SRB2]|nr:MAG: hypothetical protein SRB2_01062 [Desulfobacteraceae bacterium Eth-SRB2]
MQRNAEVGLFTKPSLFKSTTIEHCQQDNPRKDLRSGRGVGQRYYLFVKFLYKNLADNCCDFYDFHKAYEMIEFGKKIAKKTLENLKYLTQHHNSEGG